MAMRPDPSEASIGSANVPGSGANCDEPGEGFRHPGNSR